jgi:peptidoglycan/LPS O-acetylase OafA/YrhL
MKPAELFRSLPPPATSPQLSHVAIIEPLRGIAAFAVCFYHFTNGNKGLLANDNHLRQLGAYGHFGVEIFFVITGFVIPYSMFMRSYRLKDSLSFFLRRLKRVEPPYLACIALIIVLNSVSEITPGFRGLSKSYTVLQLLSHVGYLTAICGQTWLTPVFWTLAIEFQFYLLIAFVYPLITHRIPFLRLSTVLLLVLLGFLPIGGAETLLLKWLPLFAMGMVAFERVVSVETRQPFLLLMLPICTASLLILGWPSTIAGFAAFCVIVGWGGSNDKVALYPFALAGKISFSLYLVHVPLGMRVINAIERVSLPVIYRYAGICLALFISLVGAFLFWRLIERPSQLWAKGGARVDLPLFRQLRKPKQIVGTDVEAQ